MKIYTCTKPCVLSGQRFCVGDAIPAELIAPEREKKLVKYGLLTASEAAQPVSDESKGEATDESQTAPDAPASTDESGEKPPETPNAPNPEGAESTDLKADAEAPKPDAAAKTKASGKKVQK